ncbi:MAG: DNA polymerase IV [Candidatus Aureabacteria bacterium]|nr:DNA polymerase IV [Candidatus Auribacterota bacterium]
MTRLIFHLDMDAFFVSVERLRRPWLKGKPVVVGGDPSHRGVVASASYEARRFGIHSAMPIGRAKRLCPQCIFLPCHFDDYADTSAQLFRILERFTPDLEPLSLEEAYMDMSGFRWIYGPPMETAERVHRLIENTMGLSSSIGISTNKLVAKIASAIAKPNGILHVLPGHERDFLAPLPVNSIPGVGTHTAEKLRLLGASTVRDLQTIGEKLLVSAFGATGAWLYRASMGEDDDPVSPPAEPKSVGRETTFSEDLLDRKRVLSEIFSLAEECCRALRSLGRQAKTITLKLRYADFITITRSRTFPEATDLDIEVREIVPDLLSKAWTRRLRIRLIGIRFSNLTAAEWQPCLSFDGSGREKFKRLYAALDRIRGKYGDEAILHGSQLKLVAGS